MLVTPLGGLAMTLGEGPVWNVAREELTVVDILGQEVHRITRVNGLWTLGETISTESDVGAALPLHDGSLLSVEATGIYTVSEGERARVCGIPGDSSLTRRPNDAKLGPDGRLYVGVMDYDATPGAGSLWALSRSGVAEMLLEGLTIPNGMDWWDDALWFVNGPESRISSYTPSPRGLVHSGDIKTRGIPDGLTIDSLGNIWVALWGEGRVDCYDQTGELLYEVPVPAGQTTSVAFCGADLSTLAITTARYQLSPGELELTPLAGDVFFCDAPVAGRPAFTHWL